MREGRAPAWVAVAREPTGATRQAVPASDGGVLAGVVACFLLSGFAALLYQTAWLRQFSLVFGTSELAVAAVLAAYMAGLAGGAAVAGRLLGRIRRPILWYGILEAGIALSALAVPALLALAGALYGGALGGRPEPPDAATLGQPLFYLGVGFVVLAVPTGFMGGTLPLLTRHAVRGDRELGPRVALLYASNTAGAVLGTVGAGFVLLPELGLRKTVWVGVAVNALVFAIAAALSRRSSPLAVHEGAGKPVEGAERIAGFFRACVAPLFAGAEPLSSRARRVFVTQPAWILPLMLVSGAAAFTYEVLWTRLLAHVLGSSIQSFATMLAVFLTGIALGGALAGRFAATRVRAASAFVLAQLGIAGLSMGVYAWMGPLLPGSRQSVEPVLYAMAVMLPATIFIGATFPLAVRLLANHGREAGPATARVYVWNTVGAIVGAVLAGFWIVPGLGFEGTIRLAICINLGLALWAALCVAPFHLFRAGAAALSLLGTLLLYHPPRPLAVVTSSTMSFAGLPARREIFHAVGRSSTVTLLEDDLGNRILLSNGLPEATIPSPGVAGVQDAQKWLTALPVVARPDASSMLVIGFGGGVALEGIPPSVREVDVVELEPEVIRANQALAGQRDRDPLTDPRIRIVVNDARNALRLTSQRWDVIVSQPSHPWTAGASHLFTREFVRHAKAHLGEQGVFVQWMNAELLTEPLLRSLAATLAAEFAELRLYEPNPRVLVFLASDASLAAERALVRTGRPLRGEEAFYGRVGIHCAEDLAAALLLDSAGVRGLAGAAQPSTDDENAMATRSRSAADGLQSPELEALFAPHHALLAAEGPIQGELGEALDFAYLARRLLRLGHADRALALARAVRDEPTRWLVLAANHAARGELDEAKRALRSAVAADPGNQQARYLLLRALTPADDRSEISAALAALDGSARSVVEGWQHAARRDWPALSGIDAALAESRVTDAWFAEAARLRALWRVELEAGDLRLAREALGLLEPALAVGDEVDLFALQQLRARSASAAGEHDALVESARDLVASVAINVREAESAGVPLHPRQLAEMKGTLHLVSGELSRELPPTTRTRASGVLASTRELAARLGALSEPRVQTLE